MIDDSMDCLECPEISTIVEEKIICTLKEFAPVFKYTRSQSKGTGSIKVIPKPIYKADYIVISEKNIWIIEKKKITNLSEFLTKLYEAIGQLYVYSQLLIGEDEDIVIHKLIKENIKDKEIKKGILVDIGNVPQAQIEEKYNVHLRLLEMASIKYKFV